MSDTTQAEAAIFQAALGIDDPEQRRELIDAACRDDRDMRERIESLLAANEQAGDFLQKPAVEFQDTATREPTSEQPGTQIGRYKLLEQIGEGGFGAVYMADQLQPIQRRVALKIIKAGMDTKQVIARFEAERQALALMDHPNIAKVLDAGATDSGRPYFVMELVRGVPITEYADDRRLPTDQRLHLFCQVCSAVQHAHQKGIIHRDIKPSNILVSTNGDVPVPKVIDFGIAKATQGRLTNKTLFTQFRHFIGTPSYMSPEQAQMSAVDVDTRSDIYSLGILLYELLTGTTPLDSKELLKTGFEEICRRIRDEDAPTPSRRISSLQQEHIATLAKNRRAEPSDFHSMIRGDLDWIVMKAVEKDRSRRYSTATELADDIQRNLCQEPVLAVPPTAMYRLQKFARRNKAAVVFAGAIAAVLILATLVSTWQAARATRASANERAARAHAVAAKNQADASARRAAAGELLARQIAYTSDMSLAGHALKANDLGLARRLLNSHRPATDEPDLRHWEWRALWKKCQGDSLFQFGHRDKLIFTMSMSPDGRWLATGAEWGETRIWDVRSRQEVKTLATTSTTDEFTQVAFTPQGDRLLAETIGGVVKAWAVPSWMELPWQAAHGTRLRSMAVSRDGKLLALLGFDNTCSLWDLEQQSDPRRFRLGWGTAGMTGAIAISADRRWLAVGHNNLIRIVDVATLQDEFRFETTDYVMTVDFSPDGKTVASGTGFQDPTISLWNLETRESAGQLKGHTRYLRRIAFSPDGTLLASASADQTVRLWDTKNWTELATLRGHQQEVWALAFAGDGLTLASGAKDGEIRVWNAGTRPMATWPLMLPDLKAGSASFSFDGSTIALVHRDGSVSLRDAIDLREIRKLRQLGTTNVGVFSSPRQPLLAVGSTTGVINLWDVDRSEVIRQLKAIDSQQLALKGFTADGRKLLGLASGTTEQRCYLWMVETGEEIASWSIPSDTVRVSLACDGSVVVSGQADGSVLCWDPSSGRAKPLGASHKESVGAFVFHPHSKRLVTSSWFGDIKTWDIAERTLLNTQTNMHMQGVHSMTFSPDGKRLVTGGSAGESVKLWDLATGREAATLVGPGYTFIHVEFSPDGNAILAINIGGLPQLWRAPSLNDIQTIERP